MIHGRWRNFIKLFDQTFFRMAFQFIVILFIAFLILLALGYYEAGGTQKSPPLVAPDSAAR